MPLKSSVPIRRILVTVPPRGWFHGICYRLFEIYRQALIDLGCSLLEIPIEMFALPDAAQISILLDDIRAFSPQLAIGLHNGATALHCRLPPGRDGWRPHLFTDVLDLPTVCMWDHAPLELADQLLTPLPEHPAHSAAGANAALRRAFTHPRLLHCTRDSGQVRIMRELGLVAGGAVVHLPAPALPDFAPPSEPVIAAGEPAVCFIGHFYNEPPAALPELEALAERILRQWSVSPAAPLWDVANACTGALPSETRASLALDRDQTFFWRFVHRLIDHRAQTRRRLEMLGAAGTRVGVYGNLTGNAPALPRNLFSLSEETIPFGPPLARVFARHAITVDVLSPGFVDGYSLKPINGFAAGGFVLVDRKRDFVAAFGETGAAVSYTDGNDLAAKLDYFLGHPKERTELAGEMRAQIKAAHGVDRFFARLLDAAHEHFRHSAPPRWPAKVKAASKQEKVTSLLSSVRTQPFWPGARVHHDAEKVTVTTSAHAWDYAAEIPVPLPAEGAGRRAVRLMLTVEAGRLGIASLVADTNELLGEQLVGVTRAAVSLAVELPRAERLAIVLRNTIEGPTRATVLRAELHEELGSRMKFSRRRTIAGVAALAAAGVGGWAARAALARYYDGPVSDHFDGTQFVDPDGVPPRSLRSLLRWQMGNGRVPWPAWAPSPYADRPPARVAGAAWRISYIGHASLLLQTAGLNLLIDPVWSERASPFTFAGPKRVNDPGVAFEALPPIDAVLVSHNHYDHLDVATLARLAARNRPRVVTPLGNDTIMRAHDAAIAAEAYDWHQRVVLGDGVAVTLVPARHWSARGLFDRNRALWAGFVIETPAGRILHVADSGYGEGRHFRAARERYGPFRLAVLPVGAYEPRWFMGAQHMNPAEAVQAFADSGAALALGHHYGTFQLTDEAIDAPAAALAQARAAAGIGEERFRLLKPGEIWDL